MKLKLIFFLRILPILIILLFILNILLAIKISVLSDHLQLAMIRLTIIENLLKNTIQIINIIKDDEKAISSLKRNEKAISSEASNEASTIIDKKNSSDLTYDFLVSPSLDLQYFYTGTGSFLLFSIGILFLATIYIKSRTSTESVVVSSNNSGALFNNREVQNGLKNGNLSKIKSDKTFRLNNSDKTHLK